MPARWPRGRLVIRRRHVPGARAPAGGVEDVVAVEEPLAIRVDGEPIALTMRTPGEDEQRGGHRVVAGDAPAAGASISPGAERTSTTFCSPGRPQCATAPTSSTPSAKRKPSASRSSSRSAPSTVNAAAASPSFHRAPRDVSRYGATT
jgi:hypothetical protein